MLHPSLTLLFIFMIFASFMEVYEDNKKNNKIFLWVSVIGLIILGGLRVWVGADYPIYFRMYNDEFPLVSLNDIGDKLLFRESKIEIEGLYILLNKLVFIFGAPFYILTLIIAVITVGLRMRVYSRNSPYPVFSLLIYFIPVFFTSDSGHMRQGIAMALCLLSYEFIKRRSLIYFLITIYLAMGFHKSAVIFVPAYWLVLIPLNSKKIIILILISILLSPLRVYQLVPNLVDSLAPQDIAAGYTGYIESEDRASTFMDAMMLMFATFVITYDKEACARVWYYEYVRNILVFGICLYFIFRNNPVFATRLVGMYTTFSVIVIPCIASALPILQKRLVHLYFVIFMIFYYFVFVKFQGQKTGWIPELYNNVLFGG